MKTFKLSDVQADAILNMRLRNLRKLEEMEIRQEDKDLRAERKALKELIGSEKEQWKRIADEIRTIRDKFGPKTPLGKRRTSFARGARARRCGHRGGPGRARADHDRGVRKGLDPRAQGHRDRSRRHRLQGGRPAEVRVSGRDHVEVPGARDQWPLLHARCRQAARRPRPWRAGAAVHRSRAGGRSGRGVSATRAGASSWSPARRGRGFVVPEDECLGNTRKGKQVLNVKAPDQACALAPVEGELVASIGENRKMVIFPHRAGARHDARARRAAAALQGRRPVRSQDVQGGAGADLDR